MKIIDCEQLSEAWFAARAGKITASRARDLMAKLRNGSRGASFDTLCHELAWERITGTKVQIPQTAAMERGQILEPMARAAYEDLNMVAVEEVGFVQHPEHPFMGASPDGLVGDDGLIEIKCLESKNHGKTWTNDYALTTYSAQVQFQLACTGRSWGDLFVYNPDVPEPFQCWQRRVQRDEDVIAEIIEAALDADKRIDTIVNKLKEKLA